MIRIPILLLASIAMAGCQSPGDASGENSQTIEPAEAETLVRRMETSLAETLIDNGIDRMAARLPELATRLSIEADAVKAVWNPAEKDGLDEELITLADKLAASVDTGQIPARLHRDIDHILFGARVARLDREAGARIPIDPERAPHVRLARYLLVHQPLETAADVNRYLERLGTIDEFTQATIESASAIGARVVGADAIASQCELLLAGVDGTNAGFLVEDFAIRTWRSGIRSHAQTERMRQTAESSLAGACRALIAFASKHTSAMRETGAAYEAALLRHTSLDVDPHLLHDRAVERLAAIESFGDPSIEAPRESQTLLDLASGAVFDIEGEIPALTSLSPALDLDIALLPDAFGVSTAVPGRYWRGSDVGTFYIAARWASKFGVETSALRYTVPGAHLLPRSRIATIVPVTAFVEGWSLYSLTLLDEPPSGLHFHIGVEAARTAVDTGIHALGWERERAARFVVDQLPVGEEFANQLVDGVIARPGAGSAAFVGFDTFTGLEADARNRLGEDFSPRAFVDALIDEGSRPLDVIREKVAREIRPAAPRSSDDDPGGRPDRKSQPPR